MHETKQLPAQVAELAGSFRVHDEPGAGRVTLVAEGLPGEYRRGRVEARFHGVRQHAVPERIESPRIAQLAAAGARARRWFEIQSVQGSWRFEADSLQVHEYPLLFGRAVTLRPYRFRRRVLWGLLLWIARFGWGRALIGRLTAKNR